MIFPDWCLFQWQKKFRIDPMWNRYVSENLIGISLRNSWSTMFAKSSLSLTIVIRYCHSQLRTKQVLWRNIQSSVWKWKHPCDKFNHDFRLLSKISSYGCDTRNWQRFPCAFQCSRLFIFKKIYGKRKVHQVTRGSLPQIACIEHM